MAQGKKEKKDWIANYRPERHGHNPKWRKFNINQNFTLIKQRFPVTKYNDFIQLSQVTCNSQILLRYSTSGQNSCRKKQAHSFVYRFSKLDAGVSIPKNYFSLSQNRDDLATKCRRMFIMGRPVGEFRVIETNQTFLLLFKRRYKSRGYKILSKFYLAVSLYSLFEFTWRSPKWT